MEEISKVDSRILVLSRPFKRALVQSSEPNVLASFKQELKYWREQRSVMLAKNKSTMLTVALILNLFLNSRVILPMKSIILYAFSALLIISCNNNQAKTMQTDPQHSNNPYYSRTDTTVLNLPDATWKKVSALIAFTR